MAKKLTPEERESLKIQIRIARRTAAEQAKSKAKAKRRPVVAGFRDPVWIRYDRIEDMVPLRDCYHGINCPHVERWQRDGYMYRIVELADVKAKAPGVNPCMLCNGELFTPHAR